MKTKQPAAVMIAMILLAAINDYSMLYVRIILKITYIRLFQ